MGEVGEYRRETIGERMKARFDYIFRPSGPVSKEVVRQITKIQSAIPYGEAWKAFDKAKQEVPMQMADVDKQFKTEGKWHAANKLTQLWFYAPIIVMLSGRSPAAKERSKIRKTAVEWRKYLSQNPEGKNLLSSAKGKEAERIADIISHIKAGQPPSSK